jgi:hypothetical protein
VPNVEIIRQYVLDAKPSAWSTAYGMVNGNLPLEELSSQTVDGVLYLQGEVDVTEPGDVTFAIASSGDASVWIDAEPFEGQEKITKKLATGRHTITLRVDLRENASQPSVKVEITKPSGSSAQFTPVNGS